MKTSACPPEPLMATLQHRQLDEPSEHQLVQHQVSGSAIEASLTEY
ncbi:MAG: hypothetical protein AAFZ49_16370 [Cyanobacteria bacterium J06659_2]